MINDTIEHTKTTWGSKTLITVFASIVLGTNAFNAYIHTQETNTVTIEKNKIIHDNQVLYERERSDKKDERNIEYTNNAIEKNNLRNEIKRLNRELKKCEDE